MAGAVETALVVPTATVPQRGQANDASRMSMSVTVRSAFMGQHVTTLQAGTTVPVCRVGEGDVATKTSTNAKLTRACTLNPAPI